MPYLLFLLISLVWSTSFILMKKAALAFTPIEIGMWRCVWGAAVLGLFCWRRGDLILPRFKKTPVIGLVTLLGCAWPYAIQPLVIARQGSAFMALAVSFVPLTTILASIALLRVWPTTRQIIGVCGALACLGLLLSDGLARNIAATDFALAMSVPIGYGVANTILRGWLNELPATTLTFYLLACTSILLWPITMGQPAAQSSPQDASLAWGSLAILGVLGTGLGTYWFNQLIRDHGPLFAGMTTNVVPIGAVIWGWMDNEHVSLRQCAALVGIVLMVTLVQVGAAKPGSSAER